MRKFLRKNHCACISKRFSFGRDSRRGLPVSSTFFVIHLPTVHDDPVVAVDVKSHLNTSILTGSFLLSRLPTADDSSELPAPTPMFFVASCESLPGSPPT